MNQRPNIIYILADDMGYGDVSSLNPESRIRTRHLDRIAAEGMVFTDAHSSSAVCTPSRYSILTGRYSWRSVLKEGVTWGDSGPILEPGRTTVASYLQERGYATACVGKWHLGWDWARLPGGEIDFSSPIQNGPTAFGFDEFFGIAASLDMAPYVWIRGTQATSVPDREIDATQGMGFYRAGPVAPDFDHADVLPRLFREGEQFIARSAAEGRPFFLYLPLTAPHTPILPSAEFVGKSGTNAYGDFCLQIDALVGDLLDSLDRNGLSENTVVVFTSDNGCSPMADLPALEACGHRPSYHFRGHKADIFEGGHRIPLLIRWPACISGGSVCDQTVCLGDLMATCAEILGDPLAPDAGEDSVSNLPAWRGEALDGSLREATVHHSVDGSFSIRSGRWKLEMCAGSGGWSHPAPGPDCEGLPPIQLYDLETDIGERRNLQAEHPEVVERLKALLTRYVLEGRSTPGPRQPNTGSPHWPELWWIKPANQP
jgi:arylsulfatase A